MVSNPPDGMPRIMSALFYQDPGAAIQFLSTAFGFETRMAVPGPDGSIVHAEMQLQDGVIMLGPAGSRPKVASPQQADGVNTQTLCVYVDNVDQHFETAKNAGAEVVSEPEDMFYGDRIYQVIDCEGHQWHFAQHIKDLTPEELAEAAAAAMQC